jgi:hypothetical protein
MLDAIKPLLESGLIKEDVAQSLNEAWEAKLLEARQQVRAELHEEFAQRYEHDRSVMVVALDKMISESLSTEIQEFQTERKAMNEDRVKNQVKMRENTTKFNDFMVKKLAEEISELRSDRKIQLENQDKIERFVKFALAREIKEFAEDRQAVVEAKVKLVREGRKTLNKLKDKFIHESADRIKEFVAGNLKGELSTLKEDIKQARENNFGRKLFEAFASEFSVTHLNEKVETRKLLNQLRLKDSELAESTKLIAEANKLVESKNREVKIIKESTQREKTMNSLLAPLNKDKSELMTTLLESVQTEKLKNAFDKYLPSVLNNGNVDSKEKANKTALNESKVISEVTGDKSAVKVVEEFDENTDNVIELKRLAGL